MASFYRSTVDAFLAASDKQMIAHLAISYANRGYTSQYSQQTLAWERDLVSIRSVLKDCIARSVSAGSWGLLLEFSIPRKELRIDAVLLINNTVVILEAKTGVTSIEATRQIEEYALLLHYFHKASNERRIVPVIVSQESTSTSRVDLSHRGLFPQLSQYWVSPLTRSSWDSLSDFLIAIEGITNGEQIVVEDWDSSPYFPVPTIIDAAIALRTGLSIREIAHSEASEHEIGHVEKTLQEFVDQARVNNRHVICFLTGVPGSGKTLVGLSLAHSDVNKLDAVHFMSGNGPLVKVMQHLFTQEGMRKGDNAIKARTHAKTLIENVHVFARYHTQDNPGPPSNHAIIFDEAQRAWNKERNMQKFKRDYSEPEMLLRIMERHQDWAAVVALVGGGQEINDGEAGLAEWGRALLGSAKDWVIYASPEVLKGGASTAGHRLFEGSIPPKTVRPSTALHLRTSNRSLRADQLATWVNHVLDGKALNAEAVGVAKRFPLFLSRDLEETRSMLRGQGIGANRYGLVGSSGAARLRAEGLEPSSSFHAEYPWEHWYLAKESDVRSSYRCEVMATEFEVQGLELDWIGLCWGGDFVWRESLGWQFRVLRYGPPSKWHSINREQKRIYRKNAYRVLLTRARQGMVIFVPRGQETDPTNSPQEFEETAEYLIRCGVMPLT